MLYYNIVQNFTFKKKIKTHLWFFSLKINIKAILFIRLVMLPIFDFFGSGLFRKKKFFFFQVDLYSTYHKRIIVMYDNDYH